MTDAARIAAPGGSEPAPTVAPHQPIAWLPLGLAIATEAAWISVLAGLVQEFALQSTTLGIPAFAVFVAVGIVAARALETRGPGSWPLAGTLLVFLAAAVGVTVAPAARAELGLGDLAGALARNPGGILAGLAVLRGFAHAGDRVAVDTAGRVLFVGIPVLAIAAAAGGMVAEPWRSAFLRETAIAAGCFVVAGLLALTLAALADVRPGRAAALRTNPVWVALVVLAIAALLVVAIPIAVGGGRSIAVTLQVIVAGSLFPLAATGILLGGRAGLRRIFLLVGGSAFVIWILSFARPAGTPDAGTGSAAAGGPSVNPPLDPLGVAGISGIGLLLIAVVVYLLIRTWMRRQEPLPEDPRDIRAADLDGLDEITAPSRRHRRRPWSRAPRTAAEAYIALIDELHDVPDVRRRPAETPAAHARRLRVNRLAPATGIGLELLAADFGLAEYGQHRLSAEETRRAIARWRRLRRQLSTPLVDGPARRSVVDDDEPPDLMKPSRPI